MINSMTGFGESQLEVGGRAYHVEIRSVNQRYLKTAIYLPEDFSFLETEVERLLRQRLTRGSITLRLFVREIGPQAAAELNTAAIRAYVAQLAQVAGDNQRLTIDLATLLTLPGVCQPRELSPEERQQRWALLSRLTEEALDRLLDMRAAEGRALAADLRTHCGTIRCALDAVRTRAPLVLTEYRDRLLARVQELIANSNVRLAEDDLLKEVSVYAERSDISEELSRLMGHLEQFLTLLDSAEPAGRKLEFIAQEMMREANTIGSKTGDVEIARHNIEIKAAIDRIKEQVANAE